MLNNSDIAQLMQLNMKNTLKLACFSSFLYFASVGENSNVIKK